MSEDKEWLVKGLASSVEMLHRAVEEIGRLSEEVSGLREELANTRGARRDPSDVKMIEILKSDLARLEGDYNELSNDYEMVRGNRDELSKEVDRLSATLSTRVRFVENEDLRASLKELLTAAKVAIARGDWEVDGAADPEAAIERAEWLLGRKS